MEHLTRDRLDSVRAALAVAILLAAGLSSHVPRIRETRTVAHNGDDARIASRDASFSRLIPLVPQRGTIGYVAPPDWPSVDAIRTFYLAGYSLAPRIVTLGTDAEFVIAVPGTGLRANTFTGDARLAGFVLVHESDDGLLLLRRLK